MQQVPYYAFPSPGPEVSIPVYGFGMSVSSSPSSWWVTGSQAGAEGQGVTKGDHTGSWPSGSSWWLSAARRRCLPIPRADASRP